MTDKEKDIIKRLDKFIHENGMSDESLVQLIELANQYLNLTSIQNYADRYGKTYNGIKKTKQTVIVLGHKFILDN